MVFVLGLVNMADTVTNRLAYTSCAQTQSKDNVFEHPCHTKHVCTMITEVSTALTTDSLLAQHWQQRRSVESVFCLFIKVRNV